MRRKDLFLLAILLLVFFAPASGQTTTGQKELEKIAQFYSDGLIPVIDSSGISAFSFILEADEDSKGNIKVESLSATESVAFTLYPKSDYFRTINYAHFMQGRKSATSAFSVFLEVFGHDVRTGSAVEVVSNMFPKDSASDLPEFIYSPPQVLRIDNTVRH